MPHSSSGAPLDPVAFTRLHRKFLSTQRIANHPLNARLFLEQMFIEFVRALRADARAA